MSQVHCFPIGFGNLMNCKCFGKCTEIPMICLRSLRNMVSILQFVKCPTYYILVTKTKCHQIINSEGFTALMWAYTQLTVISAFAQLVNCSGKQHRCLTWDDSHLFKAKTHMILTRISPLFVKMRDPIKNTHCSLQLLLRYSFSPLAECASVLEKRAKLSEHTISLFQIPARFLRFDYFNATLACRFKQINSKILNTVHSRYCRSQTLTRTPMTSY